MYRIRFHGRGGQGMKTASRILGTAFFLQGYEVQDAPRYGAERRGAPIFAYVRASDQPINERGIIRCPDLVIVADDSLIPVPIAGVLSGLDAHSVLLINSDEPAEVWRHRLNIENTIFTLPAEATEITAAVPDPDSFVNRDEAKVARLALEYMHLKPGTRLQEIPVDVVFIGSCTNGRISDLRDAASIVEGRRIASGVTGLVVPGSGSVKRKAEAEGLDRIFTEAGFQWREPGCSMCLAINPDVLAPGQRCASTTNRNFEDRQGRGGRTHLVSPFTAAATALTGRLTDPREIG